MGAPQVSLLFLLRQSKEPASTCLLPLVTDPSSAGDHHESRWVYMAVRAVRDIYAGCDKGHSMGALTAGASKDVLRNLLPPVALALTGSVAEAAQMPPGIMLSSSEGSDNDWLSPSHFAHVKSQPGTPV